MSMNARQIAIVTMEGFNELDSFIASAMLNRVRQPELKALIVCPSDRVSSMNGVVVHAQAPMSFAREADAVIVGSGIHTRDIARNPALLAELNLDPQRQIIGAQCSGALILAKLGLLANVPACTDTRTKPWVEEAGVKVLDQPFVAHGNVATAGGCLASHYLAAWVIALVVLGASILGKGGACWVAARLTGEDHRTALGLATLMNSRGMMELILINIGLQKGIIEPALFSILALMAIVTTLMATPLFERFYGRAARRSGELPADAVEA